MENEKYKLYVYIDENNFINSTHTRFQSEPKEGAIDAGEIENKYPHLYLYKYGKPCQKWDGEKIYRGDVRNFFEKTK